MAQWLRAVATGAKDLHCCSQSPKNLIPGDLMPSVGLKEYCTHVLCMHAKTHTYQMKTNTSLKIYI